MTPSKNRRKLRRFFMLIEKVELKVRAVPMALCFVAKEKANGHYDLAFVISVPLTLYCQRVIMVT